MTGGSGVAADRGRGAERAEVGQAMRCRAVGAGIGLALAVVGVVAEVALVPGVAVRIGLAIPRLLAYGQGFSRGDRR